MNGVDDDEPLPKAMVRAPRGDDAERNRRDLERRRTAMEVLLGPEDRGEGLPDGDHIVPVTAEPKRFIARNYIEDPAQGEMPSARFVVTASGASEPSGEMGSAPRLKRLCKAFL